MSSLATRVRWVVLCIHALLLVVVLAWQLSTRPGIGGGVFAFLAIAPLLAPWPGLLEGRRYTYAWSTLCVMPYLVFGIVEAVANPDDRLWSAACLTLALMLFAGLVMFLRVTRGT